MARARPSPIESAGSGTTSSGSISIWEPSPVQRSQAPWGELKEKIRGSSSTREGPCSGQAKRSEKVKSGARLGLGARDDLPAEARVPFVPLAPLSSLAASCVGPFGAGANDLYLDQPVRQRRPPSRSSPPGACARRGA